MSEFMIRPEAKSIGLSGYDGRKKQSLLVAAKHNLREIQKEIGADCRIKPERICLNEILAGPSTAAEVESLAQSMRDGIGFKPKRRDFTQAHEMVFTLSSHTKLDTRAFFEFCLAFVVAEFGQSSILSAVIHRDEEAPHLHVLLSPIDGGKYVGSALITKSSWADLVDKFALAAPKAFGVTVEKTLTGPMRKQVTRAVQEGLKSLIGQHISDELMAAILKAAARNPAPFKAAMGITAEPINDGGAEFRRIALSTGKGAKRERARNPFGFESDQSDDAQKPYGFGSSEPGDARKPYGFGSGNDDGVKTETILYVVSPKTPTVSTCHGTYRRLTANPINLFTRHQGLARATEPQWPAFLPRPNLADVSPHGPKVIHPAGSAVPQSSGADLSHLSTIRVKDTEQDAGTWDADRGEFVSVATGNRQLATCPTQHASRTKASAVVMLPGDDDRHVERHDFYQPDFSDSEESPAWTD